ncbi:MAG: mannose-1-phosphate guanylyltransferase/mannose-6-phosphate isomerase [Jannaschia sp.]
MTHISPVILCGGSGTRLWPLSRKSYPKQFSNIVGERSLFQVSVDRLSGAAFGPPVVLTGEPFRFIVTEQLAAMHRDPAAILIEPDGRNTAPAVLAAALWLEGEDPERLMLVAPSDHVIPDTEAFHAAVRAAVPQAEAGDLITFGITPDRPETGYGYLELAPVADAGAGVPHPLLRFVEKPDAETAIRMVADGRFLWNAGLFLFSVRAILNAYRIHAPEMIDAVQAALSGAERDLGFIRMDAKPWAGVENISIDYAIMERSDSLAVMRLDAGWSDLGGWDAVWREMEPDAAGNAVSEHASAIDCRDTLLRSESPGLEVVGIGLDDIVAIAMADAVLVARKSDSQRVGEAVAALKARDAAQAVEFPRDHRPWGWFESLARGTRFQVKRIVVHPGAALSLQSHHHRSEHWIVVEGTARVTVDGAVTLVSENQSVYVPLGARHRMENPGKVPMVLIEVQTGSYLGEDDIIRYEDVYARR